MKVFWLAVSMIGLVGCVTDEERRSVLITPAHYRLAETMCAKEKRLLWIEYSAKSPKEFKVVCHSGATRSLKVVLQF